MPIDPAVAIGAEQPPVPFSWTRSDVLLYHLALGAGADPLDPRELRYAYESDLRVLPTFATVAAEPRTFEPPAVTFPGVRLDLANVLHGHQEVAVHGPIPAAGRGIRRSRVVEVLDKGTAAVIVVETTASLDDGSPLWTTKEGIFARGEGGFGGERGRSPRITPPARQPDVLLDVPTLPQQALLYRLCGDLNPLHAEPEFALASGFDAPILHGLCTYGMAAKAATDAMLDADVTRIRSFTARFAGPVTPGERLRVAVWDEGDRFPLTVTVPARGEAPVLTDAVLVTD
ncbi:3-alpha,7-alpha,12-alpha-trihydroxy-5-beta-cholest-24-enoyl-CoA hydratase [Amycolatopsis antarctica]|uniref:3-alpha,7-alpha, 12-alpha-trihydroxy-5-beta-cholest-24-enoyl-CoA hydratase n=1 Tax=Amycolatopsis antarctica TaxID=1854586 RepID=A0A263D7W4_9PSEU|nr:MaoC/PaaZ C-terminal domain-containing protein [Amycolatopsis antarctica]OZM74570.1 3-alpha,7-alpha,12-alpha-trihydroxy-5-beta-cholest-24-enoyl-CoA hydratase [Amycolatopsis antarctica]